MRHPVWGSITAFFSFIFCQVAGETAPLERVKASALVGLLICLWHAGEQGELLGAKEGQDCLFEKEQVWLLWDEGLRFGCGMNGDWHPNAQADGLFQGLGPAVFTGIVPEIRITLCPWLSLQGITKHLECKNQWPPFPSLWEWEGKTFMFSLQNSSTPGANLSCDPNVLFLWDHQVLPTCRAGQEHQRETSTQEGVKENLKRVLTEGLTLCLKAMILKNGVLVSQYWIWDTIFF